MPTDYQVSLRLQSALTAAGSILHRTLTHLGHHEDLIRVHHLTKGTNLHTDEQRERMEAYNTDKVVVLDQGSRPGRSLVSEKEEGSKRVLIVDHHMSDEVSASHLGNQRLIA
jgi:nanoRNase/pAp phosphatase (c-di-AMP/oligoRNAs hydrolase)